MRLIFILLLFCIASNTFSAKWYVEAEKNGHVEWSKDSIADIYAPGGLTLWYSDCMQGNVVIEYEARILSDERVSDLNCFWMATDANGKSPINGIKQRGGKFVNSYALKLYYLGYGGNHNSTTRFRRYNGDTRGIENAAYRPAILREYLDAKHLLSGDHWYKIRIETKNGHTRYTIDGECIVDYTDPQPLTRGWFGFRTTLAHAQLRNFRYHCEDRNNSVPLISLNNTSLSEIQTLRPATFGVPFGQGELTSGYELLLNCDGKERKADWRPIATWPDGSTKWMSVTSVIPHNAKQLNIQIRKKQNKKKAVTSNLTCPTPALSSQGNILDAIAINGKKVLGEMWLEQNGKRQTVKNISMENNGDICQSWRLEGDNFVVRLYTYKGSNEIKLVHTAFIDSTTNANGLHSLALKTKMPLHSPLHQRAVVFMKDSTHLQRMDIKPLIARRPIHLDENGNPTDTQSENILSEIAAWDGVRLSQLSPNAFSIRKRATNRSPYIGTIEGHRAPGVMAIGDKVSSVAFHLTDFWQSYPSTLQVDNARQDTATISLYLWSPEAEAMCFNHYDTIPHGLNAAYEDIQPGMSTAAGIARTSTIYINVGLDDIDTLSCSLADYAVHSTFVPSPTYLHSKKAFGYWSLAANTDIDRTLDNIMQYYADQQEEHSWYGFFNYGDVMHSYDASRGEWRYDVGGFAWDNTELGTPAMLWYQFLRTGNAKTWQLATAMTRHCSEIDSYHKGPHAGLGTRHNVLHWGCGAKEARISQAFWNRFMYYLTGGDERLGDIMHETVDADQLLYKLDPMRLAQPRSAKHPCTAPARLRIGPDWLAYAGNWFTEWERTGNTAYREKILSGMRSIASLPHGLFSGPKALGYDPATGIITWEGDSALQNTNHLLTIMGGFEMMNEMMLSVTTPEWEKVWLQHAIDYKDKALSISRNKFRVPRLQAYAYWLTGNKKHLDNAWTDLHGNQPFKMLEGQESMNTIPMGKGGFYTNDAATFTLDAIFMQEVAPLDR